jgi:uncharacterized membrane protein YozB (DUF420 family)
MQPLSEAFIDDCPVERGFRIRGLEMTRIEVFVDAAFAFALTMLAISFDEIPGTFDEMMTALKRTPAFIAAAAWLVWIWWNHNTWSRRFGLEDAWTAALSTALLIVVMVYVYPLRILAEGAFGWMTNQWLPSPFQLQSWDELRGMFAFLGIAFAVLCAVFLALYAYAIRNADALRLDARERYLVRTTQMLWASSAFTGLLSVILAVTLPDGAVPFSGFAYFLLGVFPPLIEMARHRGMPSR